MLLVAFTLTAGLLVASHPPAAAATPERVLSESQFGFFQPIRTEGYLAWQQNSRQHPNMFDVFVRRDGEENATKVNGPRVSAANGDIDGDTFVFQAFTRNRSNLRFRDLVGNDPIPTPPRVNTSSWEYWPSISGQWLLFGRLLPNGTRRLILYDLTTGRSRRLAQTKAKKAFLEPGQVNGNWVVWTRCPAKGRCNVFRYNIGADRTLRLPNPGRFQRSASVTENGTVYFARTARRCGRFTRLMRYSPGRGHSLVTELAGGADISSTHVFDHPSGNKEVYYEHNVCADRAGSQVWKIVDPRVFELSVDTTGVGTVTSSPTGIDCGSDCDHEYEGGTEVTLTATPGAGSGFAGWGGACSGVATPTCTVQMDEHKEVTAAFSGTSHTLAVERTGTGTGTITSSPAGIDCGSDCSESYAFGTSVVLTATAAPSSAFTGWSGACSGSSPTCTVTLDQDRSATANFVPAHTLSVVRTGNGTVTSNPAGINCGTTCTANYAVETIVQLTAIADSGDTFSGWGGHCAAAGTQTTCAVTMNQARNVSASFTQVSYSLTVTTAGGGTVTSLDGKIDCPDTCSAIYDFGDEVKLTATPDANSEFVSWGGNCSGTGPSCTVTMDVNKNVTATFQAKPVLDVVVEGDGRVTSEDGNIDCTAAGGSGCSATYPRGTPVELTATPEDFNRFDGWDGDCAGETTEVCVLTMNEDKDVTARFEFGVPVQSTSRLSLPARLSFGGGGPTEQQRAYQIP